MNKIVTFNNFELSLLGHEYIATTNEQNDFNRSLAYIFCRDVYTNNGIIYIYCISSKAVAKSVGAEKISGDIFNKFISEISQNKIKLFRQGDEEDKLLIEKISNESFLSISTEIKPIYDSVTKQSQIPILPYYSFD